MFTSIHILLSCSDQIYVFNCRAFTKSTKIASFLLVNMYTLIFCRFHACFSEDIKGNGNTSAAFTEWGYTCNRASLRFIKQLILCIFSIYLIYSSIWSTCLHVILFTWLHYVLLIYLDFVYCSCIIILRIYDYMITCLQVHMYTVCLSYIWSQDTH